MDLLMPVSPFTSSLPEELTQDILEYLSHRDLFQVALTSRWGYNHAVPRLWKDLELKDCRTLHPRQTRPQLPWERCCDALADEHDDTPIIKKLLVLATNPFVASKVQTVLHRCHLPAPGIYHELPLFSFQSASLSQDGRTHKLLRLAIWNMTNVHTLRIIFGHYNLAYGLIWGFLHPDRPREIPLRRMWLESCSLALPRPGSLGCSHWPDLSGLESLRIRRLSYLNDSVRGLVPYDGFALGRGNAYRMLQNGVGGEYKTSIDEVRADGTVSLQSMPDAKRFDSLIYEGLPEAQEYLSTTDLSEHDFPLGAFGTAVPVQFLKNLLLETSATLTSLNLDMLLTYSCCPDRDDSDIHELLCNLSILRFRNLRAFQMRNVMTPWTSLPQGTYLLDAPEYSEDWKTLSTSFLDFMEAHPNLQCLAWPMERFFSHHRSSDEVRARQEHVITNLGRTLIELRVDTSFSDDTEEEMSAPFHSSPGAAIRRHRFISQFASRMAKVEHLKLEGGIPRDEKREVIRALHRCPLSKIVMIANSCPIGNAWGNSDFFRSSISGVDDWGLEDEDADALIATARKAPAAPGPDFRFDAQYGWPASSLMTHVIASFHAATVKELKFCGYTGAPILYTPTTLSHPLLSPLCHFHNLEKLTLSMWMDTNFEGRYRDEEVIAYWLNARDPSSTALAVIDDRDRIHTPDRPPTPPGAVAPELQQANPPQQQQQQHPQIPQALIAVTGDPVTGPEPVIASATPLSWPERLRSQYAPRAIAAQVAAQLGPYLSPRAKARQGGGVLVRASFCLGHHGGTGTVFDVDVDVGSADRVLRFAGPREEGERERWWGKVRERRWF